MLRLWAKPPCLTGITGLLTTIEEEQRVGPFGP